jgi:hypothetical protein
MDSITVTTLYLAGAGAGAVRSSAAVVLVVKATNVKAVAAHTTSDVRIIFFIVVFLKLQDVYSGGKLIHLSFR